MKKAKEVNKIGEIINYTISKEQEGTLTLARKDGNIYVCFKDSELQDFFREWFEILLLFKKEKVKELTYRLTVEAMTKKYNDIVKIKETPKEEKEDEPNEPTETEQEQPTLLSMDDDL